MKTYVSTKVPAACVALTVVRRHRTYFVIAARGKDVHPQPGRGHSREAAVADALQCARILYSTPEVECDLLRSETTGAKVHFVLEDETLHPMPLVVV